MTVGQGGQGQAAGTDTPPVQKEETPQEAVVRLQQELAFLQNKLQVVGSVTRHDILNQMTAIMGYNEILLSMIEDEKLRRYLTIEHEATEKMRRIFAYSKVFQLTGTEPPRWQRLDGIVHMACDEADLKSVSVRQGAGPVSLFTEPQIYKVFSYLFDNAVRHGKTTTEIRLTINPGPENAVLVVEDNGSGIPGTSREKIFDHGFGKYTGWGLFVARYIVEANGMTIRETGQPGKGARFEIVIPNERIRIGTEKTG
ncbi:MAG: sensory histidine kinase AtoS [Methanoregula sp. PtaU1.Bin051]|nr:MAG: sensory histidine kinase AtoS [Methanoregula sp. PtaU1.Bin051]